MSVDAPPTHELSDSEIMVRYGPLIQSGFDAFQLDPTYVVEMVEAGAKAQQRKKQRTVRVPQQRCPPK